MGAVMPRVIFVAVVAGCLAGVALAWQLTLWLLLLPAAMMAAALTAIWKR